MTQPGSGSETRHPGRVRRIGPDGPAILVDDEQPTFWDRVEAGAWEPGTLALIARAVAPGTTFLDIGAWVGALSLQAASLGARVVAVEADPEARRQLERNLAANPGLASAVTVVAAAAAPLPGSVPLGARRKPGDSMSSVLLAGAPTRWTAPAVTPAELAALVGPGGALFVKLDIEGGEYGLLPAMAPLLGRQETAILVSLHPGILREAGDPDPDTRLAAALGPLAGWRAFAVGPDGEEPRGVVPEAVLRDASRETWLFRRA